MSNFSDDYAALNLLIGGLGNDTIAPGNSYNAAHTSQLQKIGGIFNLAAIANGQSIAFNSTNKTFVPASFSLTSHTHSEYSPTNHTHSEYSPTNHTHSQYAPIEHTHSIEGVFASVDHSHSQYAPTAHSHAITDITNLQSTLNTFTAVTALSGSSVSINASNGGFFTLTLSANTTISAISTTRPGQSLYLSVTQDSTGNRTLTFPAGTIVTGQIDSTANSNSVVRLITFNSGTNWEAVVIKPSEIMIYPPITVTINSGSTNSSAFAIPGKLVFIDVPITSAAARTVTLQVLGADGTNWISSGITWTTSTTLNTLVSSETLARIAGLCDPSNARFRLSMDSSLAVGINHIVRSRT